jgi:hypothetical protein
VQALDDHDGGPRRVQVGLPAVQGQDLQASRDRYLLGVALKWGMA